MCRKLFLFISLVMLINTTLCINLLVADSSSHQTRNVSQSENRESDKENPLLDTVVVQKDFKDQALLDKVVKYTSIYVIGGATLFAIGLGATVTYIGN